MRPITSEFKDVLTWCGDWAETHDRLSFIFLLLVYLCAALGYSLVLPLWHDELFTYHIAQAPSLSGLVYGIRTVDLNPPLSYLLTRTSFRLFGVGTLQCRLPEIVGFALAMLGVFIFARRRTGNAYGLLAVTLLLSSEPAQSSIQARPYGLLLGFAALALAFWQAAIDVPVASRRVTWLNLALFGALVALLLTHVFGVLVWAATVVGEAMLAYQQRRIRWCRTLAVIAPVSVVGLYRPLLRNHGASSFPSAFQPHLVTILSFYRTQCGAALICLTCTAAVIGMLSCGKWLRGSRRFLLTRAETAVLCGIAAIPVVLIVRLRLQHGSFFDRYGAVAILGTSVLLASSLCWLAGKRGAVAVAAALISLQLSGRLQDAWRSVEHRQIFAHTEPLVPPSNLESLMGAGLPLVDASGLTFVEMNERMPAQLLDRLYYLDDPTSALKYAHATIFNGMTLEGQLFHFRGHVQPYGEFIANHDRFYVFGTYAYPEDWLLRKLQADGKELRLIGPVHSSYKDEELYEVASSSRKGRPSRESSVATAD